MDTITKLILCMFLPIEASNCMFKNLFNRIRISCKISYFLKKKSILAFQGIATTCMFIYQRRWKIHFPSFLHWCTYFNLQCFKPPANRQSSLDKYASCSDRLSYCETFPDKTPAKLEKKNQREFNSCLNNVKVITPEPLTGPVA